MANPKDVARRGAELYNQGKLDEWASMFADDIEFTSPMSGQIKGREAVKDFFVRGRQSFPDAKVNISKIVSEGNVTVVEYTVAGTNTGPLKMPTGQTIPPTNKKFNVPSLDISTADDSGQIKSMHQYFDVAGAMMQLGLMPAPAGAPA